MCTTERRYPSSISKSKGGTRPSRAGMGRYSKRVQTVVSELGLAAPEEVLHARTRTVLMYPDFVVKIPTSDEGEMSNCIEARASRDPESIPVSPTRIEEVDGMAVAVMNRVVPVENPYAKDMPWWVSYVDCGQVGHLPDGRLVAYDL